MKLPPWNDFTSLLGTVFPGLNHPNPWIMVGEALRRAPCREALHLLLGPPCTACPLNKDVLPFLGTFGPTVLDIIMKSPGSALRICSCLGDLSWSDVLAHLFCQPRPVSTMSHRVKELVHPHDREGEWNSRTIGVGGEDLFPLRDHHIKAWPRRVQVCGEP